MTEPCLRVEDLHVTYDIGSTGFGRRTSKTVLSGSNSGFFSSANVPSRTGQCAESLCSMAARASGRAAIPGGRPETDLARYDRR